MFVDIVLGQGAFGKVMRADMKCKDPNSTPQVAVKMVRGKYSVLF